MSDKSKYLKISEIANILDASEATVRNWQKTNVIPCHITEDEIEQVKESVKSRNNKRANKTKNLNCMIPVNYLDNRDNEQTVKDICDRLNDEGFTLKQKIYLLSLIYLRQKNELDNAACFKRSALEEICEEFSRDVEKEKVMPYLNTVDYSLPDDESDILGAFYQSLRTVGNKSKSGSFYTPPSLAKQIIDDDGVSHAKVLDPCCGTGSFLIKLSSRFSFDDIYAFDNDEYAVYLAKINVLVAFPDVDKMPNVFEIDSLDKNVDVPNIEYICSNPPWGAFKNSDRYLDYRNVVGSSEVFSMFLYRYIDALDDGGRLSFVLPESFLNVSSHSKIRSYICNNFSINRIEFLGRQFADVFTPVILVSIDKIYPSENHKLKIKTGNDEFEVEQSSYQKNIDCIYDVISPDSIENRIINKIYSVGYHTLKDKAQWVLGIVTGNNSLHLKGMNDGNLEPVFTGKEVNKMKLDEPKYFIKFDKDSFQQASEERNYRVGEKLIYKFISSDLAFAYDDSRSLTLNSANILIPDIANYSVKLVGAILNSSVCNFVFKKKFNTFKVLKRHIESLPIVSLSLQQIEELKSIIDDYINDACDFSRINDYILDVYAFTEEELDVLRKF